MIRDVTFVPATIEDAFMLAQTMRPKDVAELEVCGLTPWGGLMQSLEMSRYAWTAKRGEEIGAMFGIEPLDTVLGHADRLWLLTGEAFGRYPVAFFRAARLALREMLAHHPVLTNYIDARYAEALRMAARLGATFESAVLLGPRRAPFIPFTIRRS